MMLSQLTRSTLRAVPRLASGSANPAVATMTTTAFAPGAESIDLFDFSAGARMLPSPLPSAGSSQAVYRPSPFRRRQNGGPLSPTRLHSLHQFPSNFSTSFALSRIASKAPKHYLPAFLCTPPALSRGLMTRAGTLSITPALPGAQIYTFEEPARPRHLPFRSRATANTRRAASHVAITGSASPKRPMMPEPVIFSGPARPRRLAGFRTQASAPGFERVGTWAAVAASMFGLVFVNLVNLDATEKALEGLAAEATMKVSSSS